MLAKCGGFRHNQMRGFTERFNEQLSYNQGDDEQNTAEIKPAMLQRINIFIKRRASDGDLWVEGQVISDSGKTRSYFISKNKKISVWDKPPFGAEKVVYLKDCKRVYRFMN